MNVTRTRALLGLLTVAVLVSSLLTTTGAAARDVPPVAPGARSAPVGSDHFVAGRPYRGDFPDPAVIKVGPTYFAYSTTIASLNLPVMSSPDLVHWKVRGEGQPRSASWARGSRRHAITWAPTVARFGRMFVHAYATPVRGVHPRKMCISVSRSRRPVAKFVDRTRVPLACPTGRGAIDPQFMFVGGAPYLLWKGEQTRSYPADLRISPLSRDGLRLIGPSHTLLTVHDPWEGSIIENPSMIAYRGRYYLFYSGGSYADGTYGTGYAICSSALGPCTRVADRPLLATGGSVSGPGGAMAFYDGSLRLRLAYAAWDYGHTGYPSSSACLRSAYGCNQRRLHIATLGPDTTPGAVPGALVVTSRG